MTESPEHPRKPWIRGLLVSTLPGPAASATSAYLVAWFVAVHSQTSTSHLSFWYPVTYGVAAVFVVSVILWCNGARQNHRRNPGDIGFAELHKQGEETAGAVRDLYSLVAGDHGLRVARSSGPPEERGTVVDLPPGAYVSAAVGVGPVSVVVPSGLTFGTAEVGPVERTLDLQGQVLYLPEGATISAPATTSFGLSGTAQGEVSE